MKKVPNWYLPSEVDADGRAHEFFLAIVVTCSVMLLSTGYYWFQIECVETQLSPDDPFIANHLDNYCDSIEYNCTTQCGCIVEAWYDNCLVSGCNLVGSECSDEPFSYCYTTGCGNYFGTCTEDTPNYLVPSRLRDFPDLYQEFDTSFRKIELSQEEHLSLSIFVPTVFTEFWHDTDSNGLCGFYVATNNICWQSRTQMIKQHNKHSERFLSDPSFTYNKELLYVHHDYETFGSNTVGTCFNISIKKLGTCNTEATLINVLWNVQRDYYPVQYCNYSSLITSISLAIPLATTTFGFLGSAIMFLRKDNKKNSRTSDEEGGQSWCDSVSLFRPVRSPT